MTLKQNDDDDNNNNNNSKKEQSSADDAEIVIPPSTTVEAAATGAADMETGRVSTERRRFPDPFYDPITLQLMKDPVVNSEGDSFDKSTVWNTSNENSADAASLFYPNRALKSIIEEELEMTDQSWKGSLRRFDKSLRQGWGRLVEQSIFPTGFRPLPTSFYCPIMCEVMTDPIITKEGITYEGDAIEHWIRVNHTSPLTRNPLTMADLRPNNALYELIQHEKKRHPESMHPSIRRWKEQTDETSRRPRPHYQQPTSGESPAPSPLVLNTANIPTTPQEIDALELQRRQKVLCCTMACACATFLVLITVSPYLAMIVLIAFVVCASKANANNNNDQGNA